MSSDTCHRDMVVALPRLCTGEVACTGGPPASHPYLGQSKAARSAKPRYRFKSLVLAGSQGEGANRPTSKQAASTGP